VCGVCDLLNGAEFSIEDIISISVSTTYVVLHISFIGYIQIFFSIKGLKSKLQISNKKDQILPS
jgi:hypothetical protein